MPFFDGVRNRVYFRQWDAEAPWARVILLHGFGEHSGHYHRLAAQLNDAGLDVWGLDHLGHGHTGGEPGMFSSVDELAANAEILARQMLAEEPELPVFTVGHSLGALTGALLASRNPELRQGLVMTGAPLWGLPREADGRTDLVMAADRAYLDALDNDPLGFDTAPAEPNLWQALTVAGGKVRNCLPGLTIPILFVNGEFDCFASPQKSAEFASELADATAVSVPGGYHDIPNDVPHRHVSTLIVEALREWADRGSSKVLPHSALTG